MFVQVLLALLLGMLAGVITGLIPGIHVNLISLGILASLNFLLKLFSPLQLIVLIISMGITHTFLDVIPAVFLGAPSSDTALLVLPAHKLLARGQGMLAVRLATLGGLLSILLITLLSPAIYLLIKYLYPHIEHNMGFLLLLFIAYFIIRPHTWKARYFTLLVFLLSGILGLIVLNHGNFRQPLFPMLSGLFGMSLLINSLLTKSNINKQTDKRVKLSRITIFKAVSGACIGGLITGVFPGIGSAQAAMLGKSRKLGSYGFIMLNGGVNTVNFCISLFALHLLNKARNGAVITVKQISRIGLSHLILLMLVSLFVSGIASLLTLGIGKYASKNIHLLNYKKLTMAIVLLITGLAFVFSGIQGFFVLITSTAIGLLPHYLKISKSTCMGCILLPVTLFFL